MRINVITNVPKVAAFHQQWLIFDRNMDFSIFYPSYLVKTVFKPSDIQGLVVYSKCDYVNPNLYWGGGGKFTP